MRPRNPDAITVENVGGFRGARGPGPFLLNLRAGYRFRLPGGRSLQAHVDVFNVTNRANFNTPNERPPGYRDVLDPPLGRQPDADGAAELQILVLKDRVGVHTVVHPYGFRPIVRPGKTPFSVPGRPSIPR